MTQAVDALPDDPETLKAMLIAERIRSERLVQILKDMQRYRFGRRAETLSADQLLLAVADPAARIIGQYLIDLVDEAGGQKQTVHL